MRRILRCLDKAPQVQQAAEHYKQAALEAMRAQISATTTFTDLGVLMGYSHEWVRQRLVGNPEYARNLYKINGRYKVPRGVAEIR